MSTFLYYIPGPKKWPTKEDAEKNPIDVAGIRGMLGHAGMSMCGVIHGPDDKAGCVGCRSLGDKFPRPMTGYYPKRQEWVNCGKYWLGYDRESPPVAGALLRPEIEQISGHSVELTSGKYMIPLARIYPEGTALPQAIILGPDGHEWIEQPLEQFIGFSKRAEKYWQIMLEAMGDIDEIPENMKMTRQELISFAMEALCFNYYLTGREISLYKMVLSSNADMIVEAVVDGPELLKRMKKLDQDGKKKDDRQTLDSSHTSGGETDN